MSDNWKTLGKKFSELGYEVHLVDQRNHGRSPHEEAFNHEVLTQDLKDYCDEHRLTNIVLLGHSMGGKTAMFLAAKYSFLISKLIVADISPRYYPIHHDVILEGLSALDFNILKTISELNKVQGWADYKFYKGKKDFYLDIKIPFVKNKMATWIAGSEVKKLMANK